MKETETVTKTVETTGHNPVAPATAPPAAGPVVNNSVSVTPTLPETWAQKLAGQAGTAMGVAAVTYLTARDMQHYTVGIAVIAAIVLPLEITRRVLAIVQTKTGTTTAMAAAGAAIAGATKAQSTALGIFGAAILGGACLAGCPLPAVDGCTPLDTQCTPEGVPQSCSPTQRWTSGVLQRPCSQRAAGAVCCRTRSPYGRELHACVPRGACIPETSGADAGAEGGEQ